MLARTLSRRDLLLALGVAHAGGVFAFARDSMAQPPSTPRVEILVLYARKDPAVQGPGPRLGPGVPKLPQLSQPPFAAYNTFAFVGQTTLKLDVPKAGEPWNGKPSGTYALVPGKPMTVALLDRLPDKRFHMGATIGAESPDVVRWDAPDGEPVFIAGHSYKDGILVVGITLRAP
jgi:hypothetical protein